MAIYVYNTNTGALVSEIPDSLTIAQAQAANLLASAAQLSNNGLSAVDNLPALSPTVAWDTVNKTTMTVTAPVVPNFIPTFDFILLFTPAEHAAIAASTDQVVQQFIMAVQVVQQIDLNNPIVQNGVAYLVSVGLLTQANANLILSGQKSQ